MMRLLCSSCRSALDTAQAAIRVLDDGRISHTDRLVAQEELLTALDRLGRAGQTRSHNLSPYESGAQ
jgi:hypothetical protein